MIEPEKFQKDTINAIRELQETLRHTMSRQLALGAVTRAILAQAPLAALPALLEVYEAEVDHQVANLEPRFQHPKFWLEWSELIEARIAELQRLKDSKKPG